MAVPIRIPLKNLAIVACCQTKPISANDLFSIFKKIQVVMNAEMLPHMPKLNLSHRGGSNEFTNDADR